MSERVPEVVAVIDIGSNSGRIVVYRYQVEGGHMQILTGSRASLRLVRELDKTHRLAPDAVDRAYDALQDFRAIAQGAGAKQVVALATSAVRDAENGPAFIERVRSELGVEIRTLSGEEEARYGFLGGVRGLPVDHGVLFDLGGGSIQVTRFRQRRLMSSLSLPLGALRVSDAFLASDPASPSEIRRLREHARERFNEAGIVVLERGEDFVGTGGTVRNLAKIDRRSRSYPITRLHGYLLGRQRLDEIVELVASRKQKKRAEIPGLNDDRGDSIVGGSLVIQTLMDLLKAPGVLVSGQGVREGMAMTLATDRLPPPREIRAASVAALASRFDAWSPEPARRRAKVAASLLGALELQADPEIEEALGHAAMLLDIGRSIDFFERHEHVADIVLATDLDGFSHRAVALLSAIVRSAGDEEANPKDYAPLLKGEDRQPMARAAALLALADDIEERCPRGAEIDVDCQVKNKEVVLSVPALAGWRPRTIAGRFERAFGRKLTVVKSGS
jgi:exopolyphosphatase / guanosine-5'-triphosphate,3'-diphosphate pyrophosphatase